MDKIRFSVMHVSPQATNVLKSILDQFEAKYQVRVELLELDWVTARDELNRVVYVQQGLDISQIGSTWLSDYASMYSLLPILPEELPKIVNAEDYHLSPWKSVHQLGDDTIWAIPWLEEPYLLYYRKDVLEEAGISAKDAFATIDLLEETAAKLRDFGISVPVLLPIVVNRYVFLHSLASWVWSVGGCFTSIDGRKMRFSEPEALAGMRKYFGLLRYIAPESRKVLLSDVESKKLLCSKDMAITFGTLRWPFEHIPRQDLNKWNTSVLPGTQFVGGSSLAIWKHTRNKKGALQLIEFLLQPEVALKYADASWSLPTHKDAQLLAVKEDPSRRTIIKSLSSARSYKSVRMWGMVETRLLDALMEVAANYLKNPQASIDDLLENYIVSLGKRLSLALSE